MSQRMSFPFRLLKRALVVASSSLFLAGVSAAAQDVTSSDRQRTLLAQINDTEWQLTRSSMATGLDRSVIDNSVLALRKAREEVSAGNLRTAEGLISRAALPLHQMSPQAMAGKHPNVLEWLAERRETLSSITDSGEQIALARKVSTDFASMARSAITHSHVLEQRGQAEKALEVLEQAYLSVQKKIATLRDGQSYYLAIADAPTDERWTDGLRRFDERKQLTEYLIIEAKADGIDAAPLLTGMRDAEQSKTMASKLANGQQWEQALKSLEVAYVKFEDSWRQVGLDW